LALSTKAAPQVQQLHLSDQFLMLEVTKHGYNGEYQLPTGKLVVDGQEIDANRIAANRTNLIPHDLKVLLRSGGSAIDRVLDLRTRAFGTRGTMRALARDTLPDFHTDWLAAATVWQSAVDTFISRYAEEVVAYNRAFWEPRLKDQYALIARCMPDPVQIGARFKLDYKVYEMPRPATVSLDGEVGRWFKRARKNTEAQLERDLDQLITGPRQQLADAVESLYTQINEGKILSASSFSAASNAIALVRSFKTLADEDLLARINQLDGLLVSTHEALRDKPSSVSATAMIREHAPAISQALTQVKAACDDVTAQAAIRDRYAIPGRAVQLKKPRYVQ